MEKRKHGPCAYRLLPADVRLMSYLSPLVRAQGLASSNQWIINKCLSSYRDAVSVLCNWSTGITDQIHHLGERKGKRQSIEGTQT